MPVARSTLKPRQISPVDCLHAWQHSHGLSTSAAMMLVPSMPGTRLLVASTACTCGICELRVEVEARAHRRARQVGRRRRVVVREHVVARVDAQRRRGAPVTTSARLRRVHTSRPMESVQKTTPRQPSCTLSGPSTLAAAAAGLSVAVPVVVSGGGGGARRDRRRRRAVRVRGR